LKPLLIVALFFNTLASYGQAINAITIDEMKTLDSWLYTKENADFFAIKKGKLHVNFNENSKGRRIVSFLQDNAFCSFKASFQFSLQNFGSSPIAIYPLALTYSIAPILTNTSNTPNKEQLSFSVLLKKDKTMEDDTYTIEPNIINQGNVFASLPQHTIKLKLYTTYLITLEMKNGKTVKLSAFDIYKRENVGLFDFDLDFLSSPKSFSYIQIYDPASEGKSNSVKFIADDYKIERTNATAGCREIEQPKVVIPNAENCSFEYAKLTGKNLKGEANLLIDGDAFCKYGDVIDVSSKTNLAIDHNDIAGSRVIVTIVEPDNVQTLIRCYNTKFTANKPGVYTVIISVGDQTTCATYSKFMNVVGDKAPIKIIKHNPKLPRKTKVIKTDKETKVPTKLETPPSKN
jgi:hypothetical protein